MDCCRLVWGFPPPLTPISVYVGLGQRQGINPARWYCVPPHAVGAGQTVRPRVIDSSFGRCCVPPHATGAGQTERPQVIRPPPYILTFRGRFPEWVRRHSGFCPLVPTACSVALALGGQIGALSVVTPRDVTCDLL